MYIQDPLDIAYKNNMIRIVRGVDPRIRIRIRIRTKISWIRNTGLKCLVVQVEQCTASSSRHTSPGTAGPFRPQWTVCTPSAFSSCCPSSSSTTNSSPSRISHGNQSFSLLKGFKGIVSRDFFLKVLKIKFVLSVWALMVKKIFLTACLRRKFNTVLWRDLTKVISILN